MEINIKLLATFLIFWVVYLIISKFIELSVCEVMNRIKAPDKESIAKQSKSPDYIYRTIICINCSNEANISYRKKATPSFMNGANITRASKLTQDKLRLCDSCLIYWGAHVRDTLMPNHPGLAKTIYDYDPLVIYLLLESFLGGVSLTFKDLAEKYTLFDKYHLAAIDTFFHENFEGDIHNGFESAKKLMEI